MQFRIQEEKLMRIYSDADQKPFLKETVLGAVVKESKYPTDWLQMVKWWEVLIDCRWLGDGKSWLIADGPVTGSTDSLQMVK